jgi:hypothetical protein
LQNIENKEFSGKILILRELGGNLAQNIDCRGVILTGGALVICKLPGMCGLAIGDRMEVCSLLLISLIKSDGYRDGAYQLARLSWPDI